ncbi:hypothetical protein FSPOR_9302 [Fusarium sporotrichioides]|uniref:Enoyl reductase (ER) domain-containing protein n=1 Tax=Fusarium sporotrichioides TaxID=5514 RepID=A0A395RQK1_FUSSP|nr:hypothetical protein FSPOR_9302 [Fusarium sporotrichioides]
MENQPPIPRKMKALRLLEYNKGCALRDDVQVPSPKPDEVLVRVAAAGFCHTDLLVHHGLTQAPLPFIGSHEPAGTIVSLGSDVPEVWHVGDRIGVTDFMDPCDNSPLMCAGATVWHAINQADVQIGQTIAMVGIGGLGVLGIQFAKARGYRVVAIDSHEVGLKLAKEVPSHVKPDLILKYDDPETIQKVSDFTDEVSLKAAIVCTSDDDANDWAAQRLQPRGVLVAAGFPENGFRFDPMNLVLREIVIKGIVHCSMKETREMMKFVTEHGIRCHLSLLTMEEAEEIIVKSQAHALIGRPVVKIEG